ncbi:MAG: hypothetical protein JST22_13575 [Bacteroidetes bacterium]|nr:hypothetical protein [Bacteroidota bacterium]
MLRTTGCALCMVCAILAMACEYTRNSPGRSSPGASQHAGRFHPADDSIAPPPVSTDTVHAIGDHVAFVANDGWFRSDAEVIGIGRDMVLVRFKVGRMSQEQWYTPEEVRQQGGAYSSGMEVISTKKLLFRLQYRRARGSESEWIEPERIYALPQRRAYAVGDSVLMMHFGSPPTPVTITAVPSVAGGTYSVRGSGDDRDTWVQADKLARAVRNASPDLLKPGTVVVRDFEYPHIVMEIRGDSCRVRSEFGPDDEWVPMTSLVLVDY